GSLPRPRRVSGPTARASPLVLVLNHPVAWSVLARCVRRASDGRDRSRRAVSGFGRRLGANFVDALAQTTTGFVTGERREEQGDRGADDRAENKAERERSEDRSIGVATDYAADVALSFPEKITRPLGRFPLQVIHDVLKVLHAHHASRLLCA